jgi:hypothetical protein
MLVGSPSGYAFVTITTRGVAIEVLQDLVRMGLATAHNISFGRRGIKITHLRLSAAGRKVIAEWRREFGRYQRVGDAEKLRDLFRRAIAVVLDEVAAAGQVANADVRTCIKSTRFPPSGSAK